MLSSILWEGETSRVVTCPSGCLLHKKQVLLPSDIKLTDCFPYVLQHKIWVLTKARKVGQTRTLPCCLLHWAEAAAGLAATGLLGSQPDLQPACRGNHHEINPGKKATGLKGFTRSNDRNIAPVQCFPWKTEDYFLLRLKIMSKYRVVGTKVLNKIFH